VNLGQHSRQTAEKVDPICNTSTYIREGARPTETKQAFGQSDKQDSN